MSRIVIRSGHGEVRCLYTEAINLRRVIAPTLQVERASNVEFDDKRQGWVVTFPTDSPAITGLGVPGLSGGSVLAFSDGHAYASLMRFRAQVFPTRAEALAAEVEFLQAVLVAGSYDAYMGWAA